jgi:hypothetical protein
MNPDNVPPWGCPWHGLVKGGQVTLPNGATKAYPQPSGFWYQQGQARRVAHPGAPTDNRGVAQVAADTAEGKHWRREAGLSGGYADLYGRSLGANRWLYIDPAGAVWLASTTLSLPAALSGSIKVTLARFGVLGGAAEQYTYTVAVTDPQLGQAAPVLSGLRDYRETLCDSTPTGSAVLFCIIAQPDNTERYTFPFMPLGWVELTLSGPGAACVIALAVVKTRAQALGTLIDEVETTAVQVFGYTPPPDLGLRGNVEVAVSQYPATARRAVLGRLLAMFYGPAGAHRVLSMDVDDRAENNQTSAGMDYRSDSFDGAFGWDSILVLAVAMKLDGVSMHSATYTTTRTARQSLVSFPTQEGAYGFSGGYTRTDTRETVFPGSGVLAFGPDDLLQNWSGNSSFGPDSLFPSTDSSADGAARLPLRGVGTGYDYSETLGERVLWVMPAMHSLLLYSWAEQRTNWGVSVGGERSYLPVCATPAGTATTTTMTLVSETAYAYGSWCPATAQIARSNVPVCWV